MKATWAEIGGKGVDLFKAPKTDSGVKNSARGRLAVIRDAEGELRLLEGVTSEVENSPENQLRLVFRDDVLLYEDSLSEIRKRVLG